MKYVSGQWQAKTAWDKTTGNLSGVACVYDGDWNLLVTGKDTAGNYKLWSLVYGDGGDVSAGTWSALKELASAPAGGDYEYKQPFLDKTDVYRGFFIEKYSGIEAYNRPFRRIRCRARIITTGSGVSRRRLIFPANTGWRWRITAITAG